MGSAIGRRRRRRFSAEGMGSVGWCLAGASIWRGIFGESVFLHPHPPPFFDRRPCSLPLFFCARFILSTRVRSPLLCPFLRLSTWRAASHLRTSFSFLSRCLSIPHPAASLAHRPCPCSLAPLSLPNPSPAPAQISHSSPVTSPPLLPLAPRQLHLLFLANGASQITTAQSLCRPRPHLNSAHLPMSPFLSPVSPSVAPVTQHGPNPHWRCPSHYLPSYG